MPGSQNHVVFFYNRQDRTYLWHKPPFAVYDRYPFPFHRNAKGSERFYWICWGIGWHPYNLGTKLSIGLNRMNVQPAAIVVEAEAAENLQLRHQLPY